MTTSSEATCVIDNDSSSSCALAALTPGVRTKIYPNNATATRCVLSHLPRSTAENNKNPYFFQVQRGRNGQEQKVVLHFQGGGLCRSHEHCSSAGDNGDVLLRPVLVRNGIYDTNNELNPFRDWTQIAILYCTGDMHLGNAVSNDVGPIDGEPFSFHGRQNVQAVLDYLFQHLPHPQRLLIHGCSAGSTGVMYWSHVILSHYVENASQLEEKEEEEEKVDYDDKSVAPIMAVIMDGNVGAFRDNLHSQMVERYHICSTDFGWTQDEVQACQTGSFVTFHAQQKSQALHRHVPFAYISYKYDTRLFQSSCFNGLVCSQKQLYARMQKAVLDLTVFDDDDDDNDYTNNNVLSYWLNGEGHCTVSNNQVYELHNNDNQGSNDPSLLEFVWSLVTYDDDNNSINNQTIRSSCIVDENPKNMGDDFDFSCHPVLANAEFRVPVDDDDDDDDDAFPTATLVPTTTPLSITTLSPTAFVPTAWSSSGKGGEVGGGLFVLGLQWLLVCMLLSL